MSSKKTKSKPRLFKDKKGYFYMINNPNNEKRKVRINNKNMNEAKFVNVINNYIKPQRKRSVNKKQTSNTGSRGSKPVQSIPQFIPYPQYINASSLNPDYRRPQTSISNIASNDLLVSLLNNKIDTLGNKINTKEKEFTDKLSELLNNDLGRNASSGSIPSFQSVSIPNSTMEEQKKLLEDSIPLLESAYKKMPDEEKKQYSDLMDSITRTQKQWGSVLSGIDDLKTPKSISTPKSPPPPEFVPSPSNIPMGIPDDSDIKLLISKASRKIQRRKNDLNVITGYGEPTIESLLNRLWDEKKETHESIRKLSSRLSSTFGYTNDQFMADVAKLFDQKGTGEKNEKELLNNDGLYGYQIYDKMKKYHRFLGVYAADQLKDVPVKPSMKSWGIILNLDPADKPGYHWVALYCDYENDDYYYYDSFAREMPSFLLPQLKILADRQHLKNYFRLKHNEYIDQRVNSSNCGYFAMHFLMNMFNGMPFEDAKGTSRIMQQERMIRLFKKRFRDEYI